MNAKEFFELVKKMREAQKFHEKTGAQGSLTYRKRLELAVDSEIKRVELVRREQAQPRLFNIDAFNNQ